MSSRTGESKRLRCAPKASSGPGSTRRGFLKRVSLGSAAIMVGGAVGADAGAESARKLPTVQVGKYAMTRLITGYNPIGGHSHSTNAMSRIMREWFTAERTVEFLKHCESLGINTFQFDLIGKTEEALDQLWSQGSKLQFICLLSSESAIERAVKFKAIAVSHHGGVTDTAFREGKAEKVHDFVKKAHDAGVLAGVSTHCPANARKIVDAGWENDFFMTCFQYVTRTPDEMRKEWGVATVDEPYIESDRDIMTKTMREVEKPCLGFKILAAGRRCSGPKVVEEAFQYAFENIKKSDAVIVGMFPYFEDEVSLNVEHTMKHGRV